jgi:hypothetical protein
VKQRPKRFLKQILRQPQLNRNNVVPFTGRT